MGENLTAKTDVRPTPLCLMLRYFTPMRRACQPEKRVNYGTVDMEKAGYYN